MHETIDCGGGRHGVLEDSLPLTEDEVARDEYRAALVALCHQREEDLGLLGGLLHIPDVIENQEVVDVERAEGPWQREIAARTEQLLYELERRHEEHRTPGLHERVAERARRMALADPGQPEDQDVVSAVEEFAGREFLEFYDERAGKPLLVEGIESLPGGQL